VITILKKDFLVDLKKSIAGRLCFTAECIGNWRQSRKKKPAI